MTRRNWARVGLMLLTGAVGSPASELPLAAPAEAGMSETVLRAGVSLFDEAVEKDELRGVVLLVARKGKIVLHEALGWRNKEENLPMQKDTLFRMASNTKPVIAAAVLMLAEQEKLALDDNVRAYLPSFDNYRSGWIKVRHLLNHTSGFRIPVIFFKPLIEKSPQHPNAPSLRAEVTRFGEIGGEEVPGSTYSYSNPGYNTLGALIEIASKEPLDVFLKARIYDPLGMRDTTNHESQSPAERMAVVYARKEGQWAARWKPGDPPDYPFVRASGGMISSATDYFRFCQMFLNGGVFEDQRILSEESVKMATAPQTRSLYNDEEAEARDSFYGFGWSVSADGVYSHGGSDGTYAWVDPSREVVGLVLTQSPGGKNPRAQFKRVVDASIHEQP